MLAPALASPHTIYGLVLKHERAVVPRLSVRVERRLLPELFKRFVKAAYLEPARADAYLCWDRRVATGDFTYVSFDPGTPQACTLDFEDVPAATLPKHALETSSPNTAR